tara:strand:- start:35402 stop:36199 length:798 start_codon:yes stop_codon:yes gene_type:complete
MEEFGEFNMSLPYKTNNINADEFNQDLNMNKYFNNMILNDQFIEAKVNILKDPTKTSKEKLFNLKVANRQEVQNTGIFNKGIKPVDVFALSASNDDVYEADGSLKVGVDNRFLTPGVYGTFVGNNLSRSRMIDLSMTFGPANGFQDSNFRNRKAWHVGTNNERDYFLSYGFILDKALEVAPTLSGDIRGTMLYVRYAFRAKVYSYKEGITKKDKNKRYYNYDWMSQHTYKRVDGPNGLYWKAIRRRRCSDWQAGNNNGLGIITDY